MSKNETLPLEPSRQEPRQPLHGAPAFLVFRRGDVQDGALGFEKPTWPALLVPFLPGRAIDVQFSAVLRRNCACPCQRDEAQVLFFIVARRVVRMEVCVTYLTFVGAVAVVLGLEVHDPHLDRVTQSG